MFDVFLYYSYFTFLQLGCGTKSLLVQSISLGSNCVLTDCSGSTISPGSSVVFSGAGVVVVVVVVVVFFGFLGF